MKIRVEINRSLDDTEVIIHAPSDNKAHEIYQLLQKKTKLQTLKLYAATTEYYLSVTEILFFETDGRQISAHTAEQSYTTHYRLYELEELLPPQMFMRVSKSTILNTEKIFSLTHSISSYLVCFQNSYKQVYVSRKYYKELKQRLEERE
nr:LytTR family DNA-binding domain-containing protein [Liquorilactobacillus satsumensis]